MRPENHPQNPAFIRRMFATIARRYDLANHILSLGLDYGWRKKVAERVALNRPQLILDLATGSGDLAITLKKYCPSAEIVAADFSLPMLAQAKGKNVANLIGADGMQLPFPDGIFDAVTIAFGLRNMASYETAIGEFLRVLKPGGRLFVLDFSLPSPLLRASFVFYLRHVLPILAGILTGERHAYEYLGESIQAFPRDSAMLRLISNQQGSEATSEKFASGVVSLYSATRQSRPLVRD